MSTPPPGEGPEDGPEIEPPPPEQDGDDTSARPPWAWEPTLSSEPPEEPPLAPEPAPPAPESGQEMLERLRDRGLISQEEFEERTGAMRATEAGQVAVATPPPAPPPAPPSTWTPPPPPPPSPPERYPMRYDVAYPEGLSRLSTLVRLILLVPVWVFSVLIQYFVYIALLIGFTTVFWRRKYPEWAFRGLSGAFGFSARSNAYALLLTDRFPSFSPENSPVTLEYDEPPSGYLSRWRVFFWKAVLLVPHIIVLSFIAPAVLAVTVIAWFAILVTGNYPRGLFQFSVGVQRWWWRIAGYFASFNDRFPPFALSAEAGPASNGATVANGLIGAAATAGFGTLIVVGAILSNNHYTADVDYARLQAGDQQPAYRFKEDFGDSEVLLRLTRAVDPGDELVRVLRPATDERVVVFQWTVVNGTGSNALVEGAAARLKYEFEGERDLETASQSAPIITVNNVVAPANVRAFGTATVQAVFVIPEDATPLELRFRGGFSSGGVKYVFE